MATAHRGGDPGPRRLLGRAVDPLVRAVGRVPATVLTKLLVAFAGTVALLTSWASWASGSSASRTPGS